MRGGGGGEMHVRKGEIKMGSGKKGEGEGLGK